MRESDPFRPQQNTGEISRTSAPIAGRLQVLWQTFREPVIAVFPEAPGLPTDEKAYLQLIEKIYQNDAYHSLSIEGYRVTPELIERARVGDWDSGNINIDRQNQEAFVARGYWQAFQLVKETIAMVVAGGDPSSLVRAACPDWYRATVPAQCRCRTATRISTRWLPQQFCLFARLALCSASMGNGAGCHARFVRVDGK